MTELPGLLLDTCALLFIANESRMRDETLSEVSEASYDGRLYLSPVSAWEIGMGVAKGRISLPVAPADFFDKFIERMQAKVSPLTPSIMVSSSFLPGDVHGDPMDRMLISTARSHDLVLVTSDRPILAYAKSGHLRALPC